MDARAIIKRSATETQELTQVILGRELEGILEAAAINLPTLNHRRRNVRLQRQANQQNCHKTGLMMKVCTQIFFQIYTIYAKINQCIIPSIYALLPNKTEETRSRLCREVEQHVANSLTHILLDFEWPTLNSVQQVYTNTERKEWFYHFSSNGWKRIQNLGLQNHYQDDENFALWFHILSTLAFIPPNDIIRYFEF